jgi:hypothetical protein
MHEDHVGTPTDALEAGSPMILAGHAQADTAAFDGF